MSDQSPFGNEEKEFEGGDACTEPKGSESNEMSETRPRLRDNGTTTASGPEQSLEATAGGTSKQKKSQTTK